MRKKRICLIGTEQPGEAGQEVVSSQRLTEIERWAVGNGFDGIGVITPSAGLVLGGVAGTKETTQRMWSMGRRRRVEWAARVAASVTKTWQHDGDIGEIVVLGGLVGYQELTEELRKIPGVLVTVPLGGASIVRAAERAGQLAA